MSNETLHRSRPKISTNDLAPAQEQTIDLASTIEKPEMAVVTDESLDSPYLKEYLKELEFMKQEVEFVVAPSEDKYAPNPVNCGVNGDIRFLQRGQRYRLPRMFLNALINTVFRVETRVYKDANGLDQTEIKKIPTSALTISVFDDPAGETGRRWLEYKMGPAY